MIRWQGKSTYVGLHGVSMRLPDQIIYQLDDELISDLNIQEYRKHIALVSQEPACFLASFVIMLTDIFPDAVCRNHSVQYPSWGHQARIRSHTRGDRTSMSQCQHS